MAVQNSYGIKLSGYHLRQRCVLRVAGWCRVHQPPQRRYREFLRLRSPWNSFYHIAFFVNSSGDVDGTDYYGVDNSYGRRLCVQFLRILKSLSARWFRRCVLCGFTWLHQRLRRRYLERFLRPITFNTLRSLVILTSPVSRN